MQASFFTFLASRANNKGNKTAVVGAYEMHRPFGSAIVKEQYRMLYYPRSFLIPLLLHEWVHSSGPGNGKGMKCKIDGFSKIHPSSASKADKQELITIT